MAIMDESGSTALSLAMSVQKRHGFGVTVGLLGHFRDYIVIGTAYQLM